MNRGTGYTTGHRETVGKEGDCACVPCVPCLPFYNVCVYREKEHVHPRIALYGNDGERRTWHNVDDTRLRLKLAGFEQGTTGYSSCFLAVAHSSDTIGIVDGKPTQTLTGVHSSGRSDPISAKWVCVPTGQVGRQPAALKRILPGPVVQIGLHRRPPHAGTLCPLGFRRNQPLDEASSAQPWGNQHAA